AHIDFFSSTGKISSDQNSCSTITAYTTPGPCTPIVRSFSISAERLGPEIKCTPAGNCSVEIVCSCFITSPNLVLSRETGTTTTNTDGSRLTVRPLSGDEQSTTVPVWATA